MSVLRSSTIAPLNRALYLAIRSSLGALLIGDVTRTASAAAGLGRVFGRAPFNRSRLRRAVDNLAVAFPEWDDGQRRRYAVRSYEHLFTLAVETARAPRLLVQDAWARYLRLGDLREAARNLLGERPCILVTGHCGNWEVLGYIIAHLGFPMHALYRPLDLEPLDEWVRRTREQHGLTLVDKFNAARTLPRALRAGNPVGFVADQNGGDRGLFVPFFGRLASTYKSIGLLAMRHETPIICGQARRLVWERDAGSAVRDDDSLGFGRWRGEAFRYRVDVVDVIYPEDWQGRPDPLFYVTARYRRAIERMVRAAPEQYLWMHRYWKSRPLHERTGKPFPPALREKLEQLPWMTGDEVERVVEWSRRDAAAIAGGSAPEPVPPAGGFEGAAAAENT